MKILDAKMLTAGSCKQNEKITNTTKMFQDIQFPAHFFLLTHKTKGYILVDTGYSQHFLEETKKIPYNIYAKLTPVQFQEKESAVEQLKKMGIEKEEVRYIFITHFHADHIAGLRDFPNAIFICSKKAYEYIKNKKGIVALKQAFIPSLMPSDFRNRTMFIEDQCLGKVDSVHSPIHDLSSDGNLYDVFGDGSLFSMDLSGHANGQFGLFFETPKTKVWLVADATWDSDAYQHFHLPSPIAKLIMHDPKQYKKNVRHIYEYHQKHPEVLIVPSHCRAVKKEWEKRI